MLKSAQREVGTVIMPHLLNWISQHNTGAKETGYGSDRPVALNTWASAQPCQLNFPKGFPIGSALVIKSYWSLA